MDIRKLSKIADNKNKTHIPREKDFIPEKHPNYNKPVLDKLFPESTRSTRLQRVSDSDLASEKISRQNKEIRKLRDSLEEANEKINNLKKSLEEKEKEAPSVEEFFKKEIEEKENTIQTLVNSLQELQKEKKPIFTYDILTENFTIDDFEVKVDPVIAKVLADILTNIPHSKVVTNLQVTDSLSIPEVNDLKDFIAAIDEALDGNLEELESFDISGLPSDLLVFAQAVKEGKPYLTESDFRKHAPVVKNYLVSEKLSFPNLSQLEYKKES